MTIAESVAGAERFVVGHRHALAYVDLAPGGSGGSVRRALAVEADLGVRAVAKGFVTRLPAAAKHIGRAPWLCSAVLPIDRLAALKQRGSSGKGEAARGEIRSVLSDPDAR